MSFLIAAAASSGSVNPEQRNDVDSYSPMNPHYFSYSSSSASPFPVAPDEEEKSNDIDVPASNSDFIPIAIPIVPACYYLSSSSSSSSFKTIIPTVRSLQEVGPSNHTGTSNFVSTKKKPNNNANSEINTPMVPRIQRSTPSFLQSVASTLRPSSKTCYRFR
jgi:hypothetical protein